MDYDEYKRFLTDNIKEAEKHTPEKAEATDKIVFSTIGLILLWVILTKIL